MNNGELESIIKQDPVVNEIFLGVFPRDKLPTSVSVSSCLIANTDTLGSPGKHWVAMYKEGNRFEFFDSYGRKAFPNNFISTNVYEYNSKVLQNPLSAVCGEYCLYYLYYRSRGESLDSIVGKLLSSSEDADTIVRDFVEQRFGLETVKGEMCCIPRNRQK